MKHAFRITESPRQGTSEQLATTPPVSIVWRLMRAQLDRQKTERTNREEELAGLKDAVVAMADETWRIGKAARAAATPPGTDSGKADHAGILSQQVTLALAETGVRLLAPEGEPYTAEFMEIIENIAQESRAELDGPVILEVVSPAVLYRDELLSPGKAVIGVPRQPPPTEDGADDDADADRAKRAIRE